MIRRHIEIEAGWFYWLCGIFESEGAFTRAIASAPRRPRMAVSMANHEIIERVAELVGTRVYAHKTPKHYRQAFRTELVGGSAVALMVLLRPQMSQRRQGQIDAAVATFQPLRSVRHKTFRLLPPVEREADRYWLAGYLEGKAYFGRNNTARLGVAPIVEIRTIELDVALRVSEIWHRRYGISIDMYTRRSRKAGHKAQYVVRAVGDDARWIINDMYELLSMKRRAQIDEQLGGEWRQRARLREQSALVYSVAMQLVNSLDERRKPLPGLRPSSFRPSSYSLPKLDCSMKEAREHDEDYPTGSWHGRARRRPREYAYGLGWPRRPAADRRWRQHVPAAATGGR